MQSLCDLGGPYAAEILAVCVWCFCIIGSLKPLLASKVTKVSFWMAHYFSRTPKRHYICGNTTAVSELNKGRLKLAKNRARVQTVRQCKNKNGKRCYAGTSRLRQTECLVLMNVDEIASSQWLAGAGGGLEGGGRVWGCVGFGGCVGSVWRSSGVTASDF